MQNSRSPCRSPISPRCAWVKTCLPQPFHNLIHVLMVCRVNLANQAMASTLSAENNLQSAMRLPMAGQHLYSNFLWDAPGPPGGGKQANLTDQLITSKRDRKSRDIWLAIRGGSHKRRINGALDDRFR